MASEISLKDAIGKMIEAFGLRGKMDEAGLTARWKEIVGDMIAGHTKEVYIRNRKLFIIVDSAALRHELNFQKQRILDNIIKTMGRSVVDDVVIR